MRYTDVQNDYLSTAVARIGGGLSGLTQYNVLYGPPEAYSGDDATTFWYVGVMTGAEADESSDLATQSYTVASMLIYKPGQTKFDPAIYSAMYATLPQVFNYMQSHKRLVFSDNQTPVRYLLDDMVQLSVLSINQAGQSGFVLTHRLPFRIQMNQE